jgi:hypothetical protein
VKKAFLSATNKLLETKYEVIANGKDMLEVGLSLRNTA